MRIEILVVRDGIRAKRIVDSQATRIRGVHLIHWYGPPVHDRLEMFSLTHVATGRALNKVPLTVDESERLIDALIECQIDWDQIDPDREHPGIPYYVDNLTNEARRLAGV